MALSKIISAERVQCPECGADLIVTTWSCGCQRASGQHHQRETYSFLHGLTMQECTCHPFMVDCGASGENIWAHDDHSEPVVEKPKPKIVLDDSAPELIKIKRIDAQKMAMERYARGLITKQEYLEIMSNL